MSWFRKKSKSEEELVQDANVEVVSETVEEKKLPEGKKITVEELFSSPYVCSQNFLTLFQSVPEVFFPIDYIASRISSANFQFKKVKDDSVIWANKNLNQILLRPNCLMTWKQNVYQHFVYKLCLGNSFTRAAMSDSFTNVEKWRYCSNYWVLPADAMEVLPVLGSNIPLFGIADQEDIIRGYRLNYGALSTMNIPAYQVWHDRDGCVSYYSGFGFMKSQSRLMSQMKPISNLIAVYEARNVIYVKRGGLGFLINMKQDESGPIAMTDNEKKEILQQHFGKFGVGKDQLPYGLSDIPLSFGRTNLTIAELQPFEETLADAISISGAYGIPAVLVPRKDQSTFSNQSTAEKSVYSSVIIPFAKQFCREFTQFLGLESSGYYLDCDFSDVDCLQEGLKEAEEVKTNINSRCKDQFLSGLITYNDWRAQIGESKFEEPMFDKTLFEMSDQEREIVKQIFSLNTKSEVENGRENQKPSVQDKGK